MTPELRGLELTIEKLTPGGDALARTPEGEVLFVRGAVPGDRVRLGAVEKQRGVLVAVSYELLEPSRDRVAPECPIAASCGGCDLMQLARPAELAQKSAILKDALGRVGGVAVEPPALFSGDSLGYRSRVRFHVGRHGKLGFFARGTHELVEVPRCAVADERINRALAVVRRLARRFPDALAGFKDVELRASADGVIARFVPRDGIKPIAADPFLRALGKELKVAATEREARALRERRQLPGDVFVDIPADAFSQINPEVNAALVSAVLAGAKKRGLRTFCDLFAGVGNFALPLARQGLSGVMVERTASAVEAAEQAARAQGLFQLKARSAEVERAAGDLVREGQRFELVVLDPPREGAPEVMRAVAELASRAVAYVACDPVTLARDLKPLLAAGFVVRALEAFDMFPRTHHFETLVWLEPGAAG